MGCHFLLQWITMCQNSSLRPVHLGWPCMEWLLAPLSYASPCTMTRLQSMKGWYLLVLLNLVHWSMIYGKNQEQLLQTLLVIRTYMENVFKTRMPKKKKKNNTWMPLSYPEISLSWSGVDQGILMFSSLGLRTTCWESAENHLLRTSHYQAVPKLVCVLRL